MKKSVNNSKKSVNNAKKSVNHNQISLDCVIYTTFKKKNAIVTYTIIATDANSAVNALNNRTDADTILLSLSVFSIICLCGHKRLGFKLLSGPTLTLIQIIVCKHCGKDYSPI